MDNYTITFISSSNLDKEIQDSNFIKDCKIKKINGLTGIETTTIVLQTIPILISILSLLLEYDTYKCHKADKIAKSENHNINREYGASQKYITVKGPHGLEFNNVPISDIPELIDILKSYQQNKNGL